MFAPSRPCPSWRTGILGRASPSTTAFHLGRPPPPSRPPHWSPRPWRRRHTQRRLHPRRLDGRRYWRWAAVGQGCGSAHSFRMAHLWWVEMVLMVALAVLEHPKIAHTQCTVCTPNPTRFFFFKDVCTPLGGGAGCYRQAGGKGIFGPPLGGPSTIINYFAGRLDGYV